MFPKFICKIQIKCLLKTSKHSFFFSSKDPSLQVDPFDYDPFYAKEPGYLKYLKTLPNPPINLYSQTSDSLTKRKFFSEHNFHQNFLRDEITSLKNIYLEFLRSVQDSNEEFFRKYMETNFYNHTRDFTDKFNNSPFYFQVFRPKNTILELDFLQHKTFEGVFIDRHLNLKKTDYAIEDRSIVKKFQVVTINGKKPILDQKLFREKGQNFLQYDKEVNEENIEFLREDYRLQFMLTKIQSNVRLNIFLKKNDKLVFGSEDEKVIETHYVQFERKFIDLSFREKIYTITDVDRALKGNPHIV